MRIIAFLFMILNLAACAKAPLQKPVVSEEPSQTTSAVKPVNAIDVADFGATADDETNDTDAFAAAAREIETQGGGVLWIPAGTYIVGKQTFSANSGYQTAPIIEIKNCTSRVSIIGNGAKLVSDDGLKFGSFDPASGLPVEPQLPFLDRNYQASAAVMIDLQYNSEVEVLGLELDGNLENLQLGGKWGDTGYQIPAFGIRAINNAALSIKNIHTHHHALDGIMIAHYGLTESSDPTPVVIDNVVSEYNARQGLSWVGGIGLTVTNSKFNHTGQARFFSAPGAGVDIEAEDSINRNALFINCEFAGNLGPGLIADSGDSANITVQRSRFIGTKAWALWPNKPYMRIEDSEIRGAIARPFGSESDPEAATQFIRTSISDVATEFGPVFKTNFLVDFGGGKVENVVFDGCTVTNKNYKGMYITGSLTAPVKIKNSTIIHGNDALAQNDFQSVFYGVRFENVKFKESFDSAPASQQYYYSSIQAAEVGPSCTIDGPFVRAFGTFGTIPEGNYGF